MLARQCAWETLSKGKGANYMEKCLVKRMKRNVKNLKDPEGFAKKIVNSIKKKCS